MSALMMGAVVFAIAGFAIWQAPWLLSLRDRVSQHVPAPPPLDPAEASMARVVALIRIARELEAIGAKSAASKIKAALATVIEEDLLREIKQ